MNEPHLPGTWPMLDILLALNGVTNVIKTLGVDEYFQAVTLCESPNESFPMFIRAPRQIACDSGI